MPRCLITAQTSWSSALINVRLTSDIQNKQGVRGAYLACWDGVRCDAGQASVLVLSRYRQFSNTGHIGMFAPKNLRKNHDNSMEMYSKYSYKWNAEQKCMHWFIKIFPTELINMATTSLLLVFVNLCEPFTCLHRQTQAKPFMFSRISNDGVPDFKLSHTPINNLEHTKCHSYYWP